MEIGTDKKALRINLESSNYGTFAEIGAGQEVARRFFRVGGAAGTIAKTMSAYDMTFSDAIYGPAGSIRQSCSSSDDARSRIRASGGAAGPKTRS